MERTFAEPVFATASADEIRQYRGLMETYFLSFASTHAETMSAQNDADATAEAEANLREVEAIYIRLGTAITQRLNLMGQQATRSAEAATRPAAEIAAEVGVFNGEANEWASFFGRYTRLVHANMRLDNLEKLSILCSLMRGPARDLVRRRETDINVYEAAWQRLCRLYQDTHALRRMYFGRLENIPKLRESSAAGLNELLVQVNQTMERLHELGVNTNAAPQMFLYALEQRMDPETERIWNARRGQNVPTYQNLREFLTIRVQELSNAPARRPRTENAQADRPTAAAQPPAQPADNANAQSRVRVRTPSTRKICIRCSGGHRLIRCPQFLHMTPAERRMRMREWRLCEHCFVTTHTTQMCRAGNCRNCNGTRHNSLLCPEVEKREAMQQATRRAEAQARANANASANTSAATTASESPDQEPKASEQRSDAGHERIAKLPKAVAPSRALHNATQISLGRSPSPLSDWVVENQLNPITAPYLPPMLAEAAADQNADAPQTPQSPIHEIDHPMVEAQREIGTDILTRALQDAVQPNASGNAPTSSRMAENIENFVENIEREQDAVLTQTETPSEKEAGVAQQGETVHTVSLPSLSLPADHCAPPPQPPTQLMEIEDQIDEVEPSELGEEMEKMILTGEVEVPVSDEETAHSEMSVESVSSTSASGSPNNAFEGSAEKGHTRRHKSHKKRNRRKRRRAKNRRESIRR